MTFKKIKVVYFKNNLSTYISNWRIWNGQLTKQPFVPIPQVVVSFSNNTHDLSVMLSYLDTKLTILEQMPPLKNQQFDFLTYGESISFLNVCYILISLLFDDVSGIIQYFYNENEPNSGVTENFSKLLEILKKKKLPDDLSKLLVKTIKQFPAMRGRRNDLIHHYEALLISLDKNQEGKTIIGHFGTMQHPTKEYGDIRQYFGSVLCEYQTLVDNLLDHFDTKFIEWYHFKPPRDFNILQGYIGIMLWWANKYGNYTHKDLVIEENV